MPLLLLTISGSDPGLLMFTTSASFHLLWAFTISELLLLLLMLASLSYLKMMGCPSQFTGERLELGPDRTM